MGMRRTTMVRNAALLAVAAAAFFAFRELPARSAEAELPDGRKIRVCVLDLGRLLEGYGKRLEEGKRLQEKYRPGFDGLRKEEEKLDQEKDDLQASSLNPRGLEYQERKLKLQMKLLDFERKKEAFRKETEAAEEEIEKAVRGEILGAIRAYADAHSIDIVLRADASDKIGPIVLHAGGAADVTGAVLEMLNRAHKEGRSFVTRREAPPAPRERKE